MEVWANLVGAVFLESVALGTTGLEQVRTLGVGALLGGGEGMLVIRSTYPDRINKHTFSETHCDKVDYVVVEKRCAEV